LDLNDIRKEIESDGRNVDLKAAIKAQCNEAKEFDFEPLDDVTYEKKGILEVDASPSCQCEGCIQLSHEKCDTCKFISLLRPYILLMGRIVLGVVCLYSNDAYSKSSRGLHTVALYFGDHNL
jgi:hypothetical protein